MSAQDPLSCYVVGFSNDNLKIELNPTKFQMLIFTNVCCLSDIS